MVRKFVAFPVLFYLFENVCMFGLFSDEHPKKDLYFL